MKQVRFWPCLFPNSSHMFRHTLFAFILFLQFITGVEGQHLSYRVSYREKVYADYNLLSASKNNAYKEYNMIFWARISVSFLNDHEFEMVFQETDSNYTSTNDSCYHALIALNNKMQIDSLFFDGSITRDEEIKMKIILSNIQYFRAKDIMMNKKSEEEFIDGRYEVQYQFKKDKDDTHINKLISMAETGTMQKIIIDNYQAKYTIDNKKAVITGLHTEAKKHQKIQNKIIAFVKSSFNLMIDDKEMSCLSEQRIPKKSVDYATKIFNQPDIFLRNKLISEKLLQNDNLESLKQKLATTKNLSLEQKIQLSAQFRAWMFLHPSDTIEIKKLIGSYNINDDEYNLLVDAMVNTSTLEIQEMFAHIIEQNRNSPETLRLLLPKSSGAALVTDKLVRVLLFLKIHSTEKEISSLSGLSLSNLLHASGKDKPLLHDSIVSVLQSYYHANNKGNEDVVQFLLEAGNSGNDVYIRDIEKCINSTDPQVQRESLYALRFMHAPEADSLLASALLKAHDSTQVSNTYAAIKTRFPSAHLRKAILQYIQSNYKKDGQSCARFLQYLDDYIDEVPSIKNDLLSLHLNSSLNNMIKEMIEKYDSDFAIFNK